MRGTRPIALGAAVTAAAGLPILTGCGGTRQDAHEQSGNYRLAIVRASFPPRQHVASSAQMVIGVRNDDTRTVPAVAVTVDSFSMISPQPGLLNPSRPVWIIDSSPPGGDTAYVRTWSLGALAPGQVRTFVWNVTAVVPGARTVNYRVAAGLNGKAKAVLAGGGVPQGSFSVQIAAKPAQALVDPATGRVINKP